MTRFWRFAAWVLPRRGACWEMIGQDDDEAALQCLLADHQAFCKVVLPTGEKPWIVHPNPEPVKRPTQRKPPQRNLRGGIGD
jgi:hypothetical protein